MTTRTAYGPHRPAWQENQAVSTMERRSHPVAHFVRILAWTGLVALLATVSPRPAAAFLMEPLDQGLVAVTLEASGESVEKVKSAASLEAVRSCVGRVFWGRDLLIATDLLSSYLEKSHSEFVRGIETLETDFTAGRPVLTLRVYVDNAALEQDLRTKRFLFTPRPRPYFKVFLAEKLGEEFATYTTGHDALTAALKDRNLHPYTDLVERPPSSVDVAADSVLLEDGLVACERHGIELLVSGTAATRRDEQKELYYDTYYFYTTTLKVVMIRVDTGDILATAESRGTASHTDEQRAIDLSITRAADQATDNLIVEYEKVWGPMVLDHADFHLLLTGVTPQTLSLVKDSLAGFSRDSKVFMRQSYDRTAVMNVVYPGKRDDLIKAISTMSYPTMSIIPALAIDAKLVGDSSITMVERKEIGASVGQKPAEGQAGIYSYVIQTDLTLRMMDRGNGREVTRVITSAKASGLDPAAVAQESWGNAVSQAMTDLNREFPSAIQIVNLREAAYTIELDKKLTDVAPAYVQRLARETTIGTTEQGIHKGKTTVTLRFAPPAAEEDTLLGKDPFLPDASLVASARHNYLEIQVGE